VPETPAEILAGCVTSLRALSSMAPWQFASPPEWDTKKHLEVESLRPIRDIEALRKQANMFPLAFAAYRTYAHEHEAQNAARLQVLVTVLQRLYRLRDDAEVGAEASTAADRVVRALRDHWGLREIDVPLTTGCREWCTKATRNYRALPLAWRHV
jgi:hypothetical protein